MQISDFSCISAISDMQELETDFTTKKTASCCFLMYSYRCFKSKKEECHPFFGKASLKIPIYTKLTAAVFTSTAPSPSPAWSEPPCRNSLPRNCIHPRRSDCRYCRVNDWSRCCEAPGRWSFHDPSRHNCHISTS